MKSSPQRQARVRNHQIHVNLVHIAEALALGARAQRVVEGQLVRRGRRHRARAVQALGSGAEQQLFAVLAAHRAIGPALAQRGLDGIGQARAPRRAHHGAVHHDVQPRSAVAALVRLFPRPRNRGGSRSIEHSIPRKGDPG